MGRVITITGVEDWKLVAAVLDAIEAGASTHCLRRVSYNDESVGYTHLRLDVHICFTGEESS